MENFEHRLEHKLAEMYMSKFVTGKLTPDEYFKLYTEIRQRFDELIQADNTGYYDCEKQDD